MNFSLASGNEKDGRILSKRQMLSIGVFLIFVNLYFGTLNNKAFITEIGFDPPVPHSHSAFYPFVTEEAVRVHLIDSLIAWGY